MIKQTNVSNDKERKVNGEIVEIKNIEEKDIINMHHL